jgi:hypothetical protein
MIRDKGGSDYTVVSGLFKGLYEKDGGTYVLLNGLKDCTEALLLGAFDFMTIEVLEKDYRNLTYCTREQADQEQALKIVAALFKDLKEAGLEEKPNAGILDANKYINVPAEYRDGKPIDAAAKAGSASIGSYSNRANQYSPAATGTNYTKTQPKPEPVPTAFSRTKTGKPSSDDLVALSALLDQLAAGEATLELPATPGDEPAATTTDANLDEEDLYDNMYGFH